MNNNEDKVLNKEQLEAIQYGSGPLLIIAGAGTGKTTVVTERIKWLITKEMAKPSEILALTFTDKAAREMEERVDVAMPYGYTQMWIMTFHSFGDRILRDEALHIGLDPRYKLMSDAETFIFIKKNFWKFDISYFRPSSNPYKFIEGMIQHFSRLKDEDISPEEYLKYTQDLNKRTATQRHEIATPRHKKNRDTKMQNFSDLKFPPKAEFSDFVLQEKYSEIVDDEFKKTLELAKAYKTYEDLKIKEGVMDFGDLITNTLKLFRTRKNVLREYQDKFNYILVDEFQDTNIAQNELITLLAGNRKNLTVVADDDQCLPPDTKISTPNGCKKIKEVKIGDEVITAVGKGHVSTSKINRIFKNKKKTRFLTLKTEQGTEITVTDNHKMFCLTPNRVYGDKNYYYVYLMHRLDLGWRLGVTNDLSQRLKLERSADRIIGIKACKSEEEARFYEVVYSLKYSLPTGCFKPRQGTVIKEEWLKKLYQEIDSNKGVERLAQELRIDLLGHHLCLGAVIRGDQRRIKINLRICKRNHTVKNAKNRFIFSPAVLHEVSLETSDKEIIKKLKQNDFKILPAKKGWRIKLGFSDLIKGEKIISQLIKITNGILDIKFDVGRRNRYSRQAQVMAASNVLPGLYLPVLKGYLIRYEKVIKREEFYKEETIYDLEIEKTHNFIANGVIVHNSIYRFRGAAVSNILQFQDKFKKTKVVSLTKNYRSTQEILSKAYQLIQNNNPDRLEIKAKIDKKLSSMRKLKGEEIVFIHTDRVENEAEEVAKKIANCKLQIANLEYKDFAILVRANAHAEAFSRALSRHGIPYQFLGPGRLFKQPEIKDLIAYLNFLNDLNDSVSLYRVLTMEIWNISARDMAMMTSFAKRYNLSLFEVVEGITEISNFKFQISNNSTFKINLNISEKTKEIIKIITKMIYRHLKLIPKETAGQILFYFLEDSGLLRKLTDYKNVKDEKKAANISKFFDKLRQFEIDNEEANIQAVGDWLDLTMEVGESPLAADIDWIENNAVNILTTHSSKGLEFPVVFLVNLVAQRFPTTERREQIPIPDALIKEILPVGDYHLEEERRLFYVGMTRARDLLYLTAADFYGEGKRERKISPFVVETLGKEVIEQLVTKKLREEKNRQLSIFDWRKPKEENFLHPQLLNYSITFLSYSQIESFKCCPLQYKYRFILRIPVPPSSAQSFGNSLHGALRDFYRGLITGQSLKEDDLTILLENNWLKEGYASKKHEEIAKEKGKKYLIDYYSLIKDEKFITVKVEEPFSFRLKPDLKIGGRIDRVDQLPNGVMELIDYKTGAKIPNQKDVDNNFQLTVYALAATDQGIFNRQPEKVKLSLYFFEKNQKISTVRKIDQLKKAKEEIIKIAQEISQSDFSPKVSNLCDFCEYRMLCDAWK